MTDPDYLLSRSYEELTRRDPGAPRQAFLRRATSEFYYALFHEVCRQTADMHVGASLRREPRYAMVYRALEHGRAKDICKRASLNSASSVELRRVSTAFVRLQEARHQADYDPLARFTKSDVHAYFLDAEAAIMQMRAGFRDKAEFLTRLMVRER